MIKVKGVRRLCSNCEKETEFDVVVKEETVNVKKEPVKVNVTYIKCRECGDEVLDPSLGADPFNAAYEEYRKRHALLTPAEITSWRDSYNLTQNELAGLIGIGTATLSRYESGYLQEESLDRLLRFAMEPSNLLKLVERSEAVFKLAKKERLIKALKEASTDSCSIDTAIVSNYGDYQPNEFSGYKKLNLAKLYSAILFFCRNGVVKTKLNKLLFYADFKHFKEYDVPITGARYAHVPFGPAPDNFEIYFASLAAKKDIQFEEEIYPEYVGETIRANKEPDLGLFSTSELRVLASVAEDFAKHKAIDITKFSHEEVGYQETENGDLISYKYAKELKF